MTGRAAGAGGWASEQLTAFLASLSVTDDRGRIIEQALDLVGEALECEVVAFLEAGGRLTTIGFAPDKTPHALLRELAAAVPVRTELPGLGGCSILTTPDGEEHGRLLVARAGPTEFSHDERILFRGMSRVLGLSLRAAATLESERLLREKSEQQAAENAALLQGVRERQVFLERLTRIQRSISGGAPLAQVLNTVVAGAVELLGADVVTLRRVDPRDPAYAEVVCSAGLGPDSPVAQPMLVGRGASGRAIAENRLVVIEDYARHRDGVPEYQPEGIQSAMAAPVHEDGLTVGSLVVASKRGDRRFSTLEQEMLVSFADHASIAITDAKATESLRKALVTARHDAMHDVLTALPNRALLKERLRRAWARSVDQGRLLALLFLDLDNFKHVNDSLGHDVGDQLLVEVAGRLADALRPGDTIARLGGDEFAVLLENPGRVADVEAVAVRLLEALSVPMLVAGRPVEVSASIGIAISDDLAESPSLLHSADLAMYEAKRQGGGRHVRFHADMHRLTLRSLDTQHDLRQALVEDELLLHYQPMIDLRSGSVTAVEALVRWHHPVRGLISPAEFIPVAEGSRLICALGEWVLRRACREAARWPDHVGVAVNLSPRQVGADLPGLVGDVLQQTGLAASRLTLEVTEGTLMYDSAETTSVIEELHRSGVHFSIDDFGTGYSSLARLQTLPVDYLKIDRSFVAALPAGGPSAAIVDAIIGLCRAAGLTAIAEGVETSDQLHALTAVGCSQGQGYLLGEPLPLPELVALLERERPEPIRLPSPREAAAERGQPA
jgi:diguanylate cyclase (GGDEF)-like protein